VLVNNAAAFTFAPVEFTTPEEVLTMVDTDLVGPIRMIQAVLAIMRAQRLGRIVNVGSASAEGKFGIPLNAVYGATKGALRVLSLDMNKELQPLGIDVVLCEGGIGGRSAMFEPLHNGVAAFGHGDGAYAATESWGRAFATFLDDDVPDSSASGAIVADVS
jgi:NAD(P)-dependent dehydrogenase (short-subunit alcohol dehydrogenase family)